MEKKGANIVIISKNKQNTILLGETFISRIAMFMSVPFLMIYLSETFHFSTWELSLIVGVNPLCSMLFGPIGGHLSDKFKLNQVVCLVSFVWGMTFIGLTTVSTVPLFFLLNGFSGICYVIHESTVKKILSFNSSLKNRKKVFTTRYWLLAVGAFLGPLIQTAGSISVPTAYSMLGGAYVIFSCLNVWIFSSYSQKETQQITKKIFALPQDRKQFRSFLIFLAGIAFSYFAYAQFQSTVSLFFISEPMIALGQQKYSLMLSLSSLLIMLLQFPMLYLLRKQSPMKLLKISNLLFSFSLLLIPYAAQELSFFLMIICYSSGEILLGSNFDYQIDAFSTDYNKGFYFGLAELVRIGNTLGPIIGGSLLTLFSVDNFQLVFLLFSLFTVCGQLFLWLYEKTAE
ncbi:MFS transporter [Enterococcus sp. LJL128]